jgi:Fur family ferric uptake transcriptional regulator
MKLFLQLRLVVKHRFQDITVYEASYDNMSHSHQICTVCGKVTEIKSPQIQEAIGNMHLKRFRKDGFSLYIYGVCSTCQAKITRTKTKQKTVKTQNKKSK